MTNQVQVDHHHMPKVAQVALLLMYLASGETPLDFQDFIYTQENNCFRQENQLLHKPSKLEHLCIRHEITTIHR